MIKFDNILIFGPLYEPDPFPGYDADVGQVLSHVNNWLLRLNILPRGTVRDMMDKYDRELRWSLQNSCLNGIFHPMVKG